MEEVLKTVASFTQNIVFVNEVGMSRFFECGNCRGALFTTHDDKREVKVCPYCGKDNYLCEIKKGKL